MRCPIDPQARPLPGTFEVSAQTAHAVIHINPTRPDHIMVARTGFIGEHIVPDDPHYPADLRSLTFSTRTDDPNLKYRLPSGQPKATEETVQILQSAPKSSKNSPIATTSTIVKKHAAPLTARRPTNDNLARVSDYQNQEQPKATEETVQILQSAPKLSKNSSSTTNFKTYAAVVKTPQAAESPTVTPTRTTRTNEVPEYRTISPTTIIDDDTKSHANLFKGMRKSVDPDGDCFFQALATHLEIDKKQVRAQIVDWLKANPDFPFETCTLSAYVKYETHEEWSPYCVRLEREHTWAGLPEIVAATQIWHRVVRVFKDVGDGLFDLTAVLGEEGPYTLPIDLVFSEARSHYDVLVEVRPLQTISTETIALKQSVKFENPDLTTTPAARLKVAGMFEEFKNKARKELTERRKTSLEASAPDPIATLAAELKTLGRLKEYELCSRAAEAKIYEMKVINELTEQRVAVERQVLNELDARKESKILEERKARERHEERVHKRFKVEWDELRKMNEQPTKPRAPEKPATHEKPKHKHESRKARAARELQDGLQAYRVHRALEELAACRAREESTAREVLECRESLRIRNLTRAQERRRLCETPKARDAQEADVRRKARNVRIKERKAQRVATVASARTKPAAPPPTAPPHRLPIPSHTEDDFVPMPARQWYGTELEHSRSTMTEFLESMVPAVKLVLVHGHRFDHAVHSRLRAFERAFDGNAYRTRYSRSAADGMHQPEPCFMPRRHLQYDRSDVCQPPPCRVEVSVRKGAVVGSPANSTEAYPMGRP